jgi:hypothetical protein
MSLLEKWPVAIFRTVAAFPARRGPGKSRILVYGYHSLVTVSAIFRGGLKIVVFAACVTKPERCATLSPMETRR